MVPIHENWLLAGDDILGIDKLQHIFFCFSATLLFSYLPNNWHIPFCASRLQRAALLGTLSGISKEVGDACGLWPGAWSFLDLTADLIGVALAAICISLRSRKAPLAPLSLLPL